MIIKSEMLQDPCLGPVSLKNYIIVITKELHITIR